MPIYNFRDSDSGDISEVVLKISELDSFKSEHPHLHQVHLSAPTLSRDDGRKKPDDGFRDVLKSIKKASGRGNTINTF
jgi:hypothetical protein